MIRYFKMEPPAKKRNCGEIRGRLESILTDDIGRVFFQMLTSVEHAKAATISKAFYSTGGKRESWVGKTIKMPRNKHIRYLIDTLTFYSDPSCLDLTCWTEDLIDNMEYELVKVLDTCKNLTSLSLPPFFDPEWMNFMANIPLQKLDLSFNMMISEDHLLEVLSTFIELKSLHLKSTDIRDDVLKQLAFLGVTYLDISSCPNVTDHGISYLKKMPLKVLLLNDMQRLDGRCMASISEIHTLKHLDISFMKIWNHQDVRACKNLRLKILNVSGVDSVNDVVVKEIMEIDTLEMLLLDACRNVTNHSLVYIERHALLSYVRLDGTAVNDPTVFQKMRRAGMIWSLTNLRGITGSSDE